MMLFALVKKDFLLIKKYVPAMFFLVIFLPPFMRWTASEFAGAFGFIISILFSSTMLLHSVSLKEYQFPKAATLLCATPFSRKMVVLSRYIFCMAVFGTCCIILVIVDLIVPKLGTADIKLFVLMFLVIAVYTGVYLPIQFKLGFEKAKFAFAAIYGFSPLILLQLLRMEIFNLNLLSALSPYLIYGGAVLIGFVVFAISALLSIKIYDKADLV